MGGLRCPLCSRTRLCIPHSNLCIPHSDGPDFIVCPPPTIMPAWGHTIVCQVIACIIIKQPTLCRALGEVYWCCGTQFVHPSWPTSRQNAKLYPANTQRLQTFQPSCSQGFGENAVNRYPCHGMYAQKLTRKVAWYLIMTMHVDILCNRLMRVEGGDDAPPPNRHLGLQQEWGGRVRVAAPAIILSSHTLAFIN